VRGTNRLSAFRYALAGLAAFHGAAAPTPLTSLTAAGGGMIVYGLVDGAQSQPAAMSAMLRTIHHQCGEKPEVGRVFRVRGTDSVAVFFNVVNHPGGNRPVAGMVLAAHTSGGIEAALLSDAAEHFGSNLNPMLQQLFGVWHPGTRAARPATGAGAAPLHRATTADGSASVGIPDGWKVQGQGGTMLVSGPHGESIGLNLTKPAVDPRRQRVGPGNLAYPANANLATAFPDLFMQFWRMNGANPTGLKVELAEPLAGLPLQRGVHVTGQVSLAPNEPMEMNAVLTATPPSSFGNYLVMFSMVMVPQAVADQQRATAGAILASFQPNQAVINHQAGAMAAPAIAEIHQIGAQAKARADAASAAHEAQHQSWNQGQAAVDAQHRNWAQSQDAAERNTQGFSNYLLDQSVVQDNQNNAHGTAWNATAAALVKANPDRFELVDTPNYWKGIDY